MSRGGFAGARIEGTQHVVGDTELAMARSGFDAVARFDWEHEIANLDQYQSFPRL